MTQHTKGPWKIHNCGVIVGGYCFATSVAESYQAKWINSKLKADTEGNKIVSDYCQQQFLEARANARLIAASPRIYEFIQALATCASDRVKIEADAILAEVEGKEE